MLAVQSPPHSHHQTPNSHPPQSHHPRPAPPQQQQPKPPAAFASHQFVAVKVSPLHLVSRSAKFRQAKVALFLAPDHVLASLVNPSLSLVKLS